MATECIMISNLDIEAELLVQLFAIKYLGSRRVAKSRQAHGGQQRQHRIG